MQGRRKSVKGKRREDFRFSIFFFFFFLQQPQVITVEDALAEAKTLFNRKQPSHPEFPHYLSLVSLLAIFQFRDKIFAGSENFQQTTLYSLLFDHILIRSENFTTTRSFFFFFFHLDFFICQSLQENSASHPT